MLDNLVMTSALKFININKSYADQHVLKDLSLNITQGKFVGLIGENGTGKTTLIKCLLDFCELQSGEIEIFGESHLKTEARSQLAFLPERFVPPYFATGIDFLRHMMRMHQVNFDEDVLQEVIAALDLAADALTKPVRALSKGMAQKLGLAATLMSNKDLLVLDEPMSGLDPKARALFKRYLLEQKAKGKTLFFSTHLLADVEALCDEMVILHEGQVQFVGSPQACCEHYDVETLEEAYISSIT